MDDDFYSGLSNPERAAAHLALDFAPDLLQHDRGLIDRDAVPAIYRRATGVRRLIIEMILSLAGHFDKDMWDQLGIVEPMQLANLDRLDSRNGKLVIAAIRQAVR